MTPLKGKIISGFGNRIHPVTKKETFHNGVDISAEIGTPVMAPESGEVTQVYKHETGGLTLIMMADTGIRYGFCHLQSTLTKVGERVVEGEIIARSGNTGRSTGPHLHFTVKEDDEWINPVERFQF